MKKLLTVSLLLIAGIASQAQAETLVCRGVNSTLQIHDLKDDEGNMVYAKIFSAGNDRAKYADIFEDTLYANQTVADIVAANGVIGTSGRKSFALDLTAKTLTIKSGTVSSESVNCKVY
ncbi:hypothetical protein ACLVWU_05715 [Bdellovibrio sp. HCB290]|uniref:hypothetical protein n=1 Tax=Bdellovibrio sp. HCB290 TaxID=3394356 RepID=UPI0039B5F728